MVTPFFVPQFKNEKNMKNNLLRTLFAGAFLCVLAPLTASADVAINETNFPDENFRNWLLSQPYGQDGIITDEEIVGITSMDVSYQNISSLQGIEYFTALTALNCNFNQLTLLDVSGCTALTTLYCDRNQLTSLDVSKNTALSVLMCVYNQLTSLDVSQNTALTALYCPSNQLTSLDVSGCTALTALYCTSNQLTSLDVSGCTALIWLQCESNQLNSLDVSQNTALTGLYCTSNQLNSLDVSQNTALTVLYCPSNQLTSLDVSGCTALTYLSCYSNQLTSLDVSKNTTLTELDCHSNQLTSLDVSKNTALTRLDCYSNQLKSIAMDAFIESLPINTSSTEYELYIYKEDDSNDSNVCTRSQVAAIKEKGWKPLYHSADMGWIWQEYEGSDDESTNIKSAIRQGAQQGDAVYNLNGQRVEQPRRGLYIKNGHKVVIK